MEVHREAELIASERQFRFVGVERRLPFIDWTAEYESPLFTYHLHYFDYATDLARAWRATGQQRFGDRYVELWVEWMDAAAAGRALIEPYPTSVRSLNALCSLWLVEDRLPSAFVERLLRVTHAQLSWLARNLETHLRANHLQKNLVALSLGSLAFADDAAAWNRFRDELWREFDEQVLPDGVHYERSPMYHAAALQDFLLALAASRAAGASVPGDAAGRLAGMTRALQLLSRPDGSLHLFNDSANDARPGRAEVLALARGILREPFPEPTGPFSLPLGGYFGHIDTRGGHRFVIDAGPAGPSYQPGHAHCDMLSFELDLGGRPVVVDSGVHGYDGDPFREYVRSTRAHNTVSIAGGEQHEMWATFRVARRGEIMAADLADVPGSDGIAFTGIVRPFHDRAARHERRAELLPSGLTVTDLVEGAPGAPLSGWLHLHPDFRVEASSGGFLAVAPSATDAGGGPLVRVRIETFGTDEARIVSGSRQPVQGWYCPRFGCARPAAVIEMRVRANRGRPFGFRIVGD